MPVVRGISHVAIVTTDLDRSAAFYCDMFGGSLIDLEEVPFGRVGIIRLGPGNGLNLFEVTANSHATGQPTMFDRGHIDHFGLEVTDADAFWALRDRLVAEGHSSGEVTDFGPVIGVDFTDPDGMQCEINLVLDPTLANGHAPQPYAFAAR
ncbi:MAG TPA: VOC family protein [Microthrixaceae bacterium]|nr:VOC family protein [Microthrixaceae bacterium]